MEAQYQAWRDQRQQRRYLKRAYLAAGEPSALSVLWQGAKAVKSKVCPIVEIIE